MVIEVLSNYVNGHWNYFLMVIVTQVCKDYNNDHELKILTLNPMWQC